MCLIHSATTMNKTAVSPGHCDNCGALLAIATAAGAAGRHVRCRAPFLHELVEACPRRFRFWRTLRSVHAPGLITDQYWPESATRFATVSQLSRHLDPVLRPRFDLRTAGREW